MVIPIKHISVSFFESRVTFSKEEKQGNPNKIGIREYRNPIICFFAKIFGLAVDVDVCGKVICLNQKSHKKWIKANLDCSELKCSGIQGQEERLLRAVVAACEFRRYKKMRHMMNPSIHPNFIMRLLNGPTTLNNLQRLKDGQNAFSTILVWRCLAEYLGEIETDFPLEYSASEARYISKAKEFPGWVRENIRKLETIRELNLSLAYISTLPKEIAILKNIETVHAWGNWFTEIPAPILKLTKLKELALGGCYIEEISPRISKLPRLTLLSLDKNCLQSLPRAISSLPSLETLGIALNSIKKINLFSLRSVKRLVIDKVQYGKIKDKYSLRERVLYESCTRKRLKIDFKQNSNLKDKLSIRELIVVKK